MHHLASIRYLHVLPLCFMVMTFAMPGWRRKISPPRAVPTETGTRVRAGVDPLIGTQCPPIHGFDLDGHPVNADSLNGRLLLLCFWFTKSTPCMEQIPELNKFKWNYDLYPISFLAPTFNNGPEIRDFLRRNKFSFPILPNSARLIKQLGVTEFPTLLLADTSGVIRYVARGSGAGDLNALKAEMKLLLGK